MIPAHAVFGISLSDAKFYLGSLLSVCGVYRLRRRNSFNLLNTGTIASASRSMVEQFCSIEFNCFQSYISGSPPCEKTPQLPFQRLHYLQWLPFPNCEAAPGGYITLYIFTGFLLHFAHEKALFLTSITGNNSDKNQESISHNNLLADKRYKLVVVSLCFCFFFKLFKMFRLWCYSIPTFEIENLKNYSY